MGKRAHANKAKFAGGKGKDEAQQLVRDMKAQNFTDGQVREQLKTVHGKSASRISQLLRPVFGSATRKQQQSVAKRARTASKAPVVNEEDLVEDCFNPDWMGPCLVVGGCQHCRALFAVQSDDGRQGSAPPAEWLDEAVDPDDEAELAPDEQSQFADVGDPADDDEVELLYVPVVASEPAGAADGHADEELLKRHAALARPALEERHVDADGHCLFHAVALQMPKDEQCHKRLRQYAVTEVERNTRDYREFFDDNQPRRPWIEGMRRRWWGDGIAIRALANCLERPFIVWRKGSDQPPDAFAHRSFDRTQPLRPVYLLLDETRRGVEHYSAFVLTRELPAVAAANVDLPAPPEPSDSEAEAPGQASDDDVDVVAELCRIIPDAEAEALLAELGAAAAESLPESAPDASAKQGGDATKRPAGSKLRKRPASSDRPGKLHEHIDEIVRLHADGNGLSQTSLAVQFGCTRFAITELLRRHRAGATRLQPPRSAEQRAEIIDRHVRGESTAEIAAAQGVCVSVAYNELQSARSAARIAKGSLDWAARQEFTIGPHERKDPPVLPGANTHKHVVETEAHEKTWVRTGSWTYCPDCGRVRADGKFAADWHSRRGGGSAHRTCAGGCDLRPVELDDKPREDEPEVVRSAKSTLKAYVTPRDDPLSRKVGQGRPAADLESDWPPVLLELTEAEVHMLAPIEIKCEFKTVRGGKASVTNRQKTSVIRGVWRKKSVAEGIASAGVAVNAAYTWLMDHNETYKLYVSKHEQLLREHADDNSAEWRWVPTCELLLHMPGVEVAMRPWLYPRAAFGDTDIKSRLQVLEKIPANSKPSLKTSWVRKLTSGCESYQRDFPLFCLLHDIALAKQISSVVAVAKDKGIAPDEAANGMQNFGAFWVKEQQKLEDMCRQRGLPNLFFTIAPAEWGFPYHEGMFDEKVKDKKLSECQALFTVHMYHVLTELIEKLVLLDDSGAGLSLAVKQWGEDSFGPAAKLFDKLGAKHAAGERITGKELKRMREAIPEDVRDEYGIVLTELDAEPTQQVIDDVLDSCGVAIRARAGFNGIGKVHDYCFRFEYQGRGTLHVHCIAWVEYDVPEDWHGGFESLSGKSSPPKNRNSPLVRYLERMFGSSVDAQCKEGGHCFLRYVTGYVAKASDALVFKSKEWAEQDRLGGTSQWRQIYRLLIKRAPLEPEMAIEFCSAQLMRASFRGATCYAQIPGSKAKNDSRDAYNAYLAHRSLGRIESFAAGEDDMSFIEYFRKYQSHAKRNPETGTVAYSSTLRAQHGRGSKKALCAAGFQFPFELLDIYVGAFVSTFVPHRKASDIMFADDAPLWGDTPYEPVDRKYKELGRKHAAGEPITRAELDEACDLLPDKVKEKYGIFKSNGD